MFRDTIKFAAHQTDARVHTLIFQQICKNAQRQSPALRFPWQGSAALILLRNRVKHGALVFLLCLVVEVMTRPTLSGKTTSSRQGETSMPCRQMQTHEPHWLSAARGEHSRAKNTVCGSHNGLHARILSYRSGNAGESTGRLGKMIKGHLEAA